MSRYRLAVAFAALALASVAALPASGSQVVAFWGFAEEYDFPSNPTKQDFAADVDATVSGDANLQAFRGDPDDLDDNGGGGFVAYTSPVSGVTYEPTRTIKWDDLAGGGDDFDIGGVTSFDFDALDGTGPVPGRDFGNDALMYLTLDGTGFRDFSLRFDIEGTPGDLPSTFDIFYRVDGPGGVWFREPDQNNVSLLFMDFTPTPDPENQFADSGVIALSPALDGASSIELIISDFREAGNDEMEIDNVEIVATVIPEPTALAATVLGVFSLLGTRRRRVRGS